MGLTLGITAASIAFGLLIMFVVLKQAGVMGPRKKVLATGTPGQALIMGVAPTGTVINEINYVVKFQLRVQLPGRDTYDVETRETVPITSMGAITPGTQVGVKVDPQDQTKVFIDWQQGIVPAGVGGSSPAMPASAADVAAALHDPATAASVQRGSAAKLLATGQRATGVLKSFSDTGQTPRSTGSSIAPELLDDPLYVLTLDLTFVPGAAPVEGMVIHRVPRAMAPNLRLGMSLPCAVDPGNPTRRIAVDWAAVAAGQSTAS